MMHQLLILYITLLYVWAVLASDDDRYLRGQGVGYICLYTGKRTGMQTLEVPTEMVDFFISPYRNNPAKVICRLRSLICSNFNCWHFELTYASACLPDGQLLKQGRKENYRILLLDGRSSSVSIVL